jgi:hypothetical protein
VKVTVPKRKKLRERAFRPQEAQIILEAALAINDTRKPYEAAKRWVPWLCAYTGAHPAEMTQLRKMDVVHAWRHTFKLIGRKARISDAALDDICGPAPASEGAAYGRAGLEEMAEALKSFPRHLLKGA